MKVLNILMGLLASTWLLANVAMAEDLPQDRVAQVEQRLEQTKQRLNLSDAQQEKITPILEASIEKQQALLSKYGISLQGKRNGKEKLGLRKARKLGKEMQVLRDEMRTQVKTVLNDQQLTEFDKMQEEAKTQRRAKIRERMQAR